MKLLRKFYYSNFFVLFIYILLVYFFYGLGINLFYTAIAPGDAAIFGLPSKVFSVQGSLWNPFISSGMYQVIEPQNQSFYLPGLLLMKLFPNAFGYNMLQLLHYAFAGFFTYLFLKNKVNKIPSFIGGMCFMFCGFLTAHIAHNTMVDAAIWLPIILYNIDIYFNNNKLISLLLSSIFFSFSIFAGYPAVSFYSGMVILLYIIFKIWFDNKTNNRLSKIIEFIKCNLIIFIGGLLISSVQILPILESLKYVSRGNITYEFFSSYSFTLFALPILVFPFFYGIQTPGLYNTMYYGPWNLTEMAGYSGILPLLFTILAFVLFRKRNRQIYFWVFVTLFGFILVLGDSTPFYRIMFSIPGYNMFRVPARNWFEVNFAFSILTAFSINYFTSKDSFISRMKIKKTKQVILVFSVIILAFLGLVRFLHITLPKLSGILDENTLNRMIYFEGFNTTIASFTKNFISNTQLSSVAIFIPLLIISISIICIIILLRYRNKKIISYLIALVIFMDLFSFGHFHDRQYTDFDVMSNQKNNEIYDFIKKSEQDNVDNIRLLSLDISYDTLFPLINNYYNINVINSYGPIWLKDYQLLTEFEPHGTSSNINYLLENNSIYSMLSNKYIITMDPEKKSLIASIIHKNSETENSISSVFANNETVSLQSINGNDVSLVNYQFNLEQNTTYKISFKARTPGKLSQPLIVDFYAGTNYDSVEQEKQFQPSIFGPEFQEYSVLFDSGSECPDLANLRFFTYSTTQIEIKDIYMERTNTNTKYWGEKIGGKTEYSIYQERFVTSNGISVFENMNYLPRVRFISNITNVENINTANNIIKYDLSFDPSTTALVENYEGPKVLDNGNIISAIYENDIVKLVVDSGENSFLVLSDTWYPGWKAYVDGNEVPIYKTNGVVKGILIQGEGEHKIEFSFKPVSFYVGLIISVITLLVFIGIILFDLKKRKSRNRELA